MTTTRVTTWDRASITLLGAAGCALSYDALQQMATAVHVRGLLTYLFPLVIDGFIAYGVRALLVLRTAPFAARLYAWTLFGTATAASIWANALHAVRLNQQTTHTSGLRLGDTVVGVLSTLAPLALAGAVHLYILIARHPTGTARNDRPDSGQPTATAHNDRQVPATGQITESCLEPTIQTADTRATDRKGQAHSTPAGSSGHQTDATNAHPNRRQTGRPPAADLPELVDLGRETVRTSGRIRRTEVAEAIRRKGFAVGSDRLTLVMQQLRQEHTEETVAHTP